MSDRPIQVGDMVVVIGAHCKGAEKFIGITFKVGVVRTGFPYCTCCGAQEGYLTVASPEGRPNAFYAPLKRIPPLEELKGKRTEESIRETA